MNDHVLLPRHKATASGPVDRLPKLYTPISAISASAKASITVALGRAAWYPGRAQYRLHSISKYVEAVRLVSEALRDPKESRSDHVLQVVLMLGLWQVRNSPQDSGMRPSLT